jgi:hypothetical protein
MAREVLSVESRLEQVTVYAHGARVRRVATLRAPAAGTVVRFVGLPLSVIDDTVRSEVVEDRATVTSLRVAVDVPGGEARSEESSDLRAARRRAALAEAEAERLRHAIDRLDAANPVVDDPTDDAPAPWGNVLAARREFVRLRSEREVTLRTLLAAATTELDEARRALAVEVQRDAYASRAKPARLHETRKQVELELVGTGDVTIRLEYQVAAARWAPSYVARIDGERANVQLRAVVAQQTGEDWNGVELRLSTAEPEQFTQLPELLPQKIGRRQHEPAKKGFREPPKGAAELYADYERAFPRTATTTVTGSMSAAADDDEFAEQVWDEGTSRGKDAYSTPPPAPAFGAASPMTAAPARSAPMAARARNAPMMPGAAPAMAKKTMALSLGGGGAAAYAPPPAPPEPRPRLDYGNLRMAMADQWNHGTLVPAALTLDGTLQAQITQAIAHIQHLPLPPGHDNDWSHTYDYAFASDGTVDIASDGAWHSIALTSRSGTVKVRHIAVPREQNDVFRVAAIANPFDGPLLPGPIDIYDRGQFLVTSDVDYTPPGGTVDVGLGVDATVKIARNVEFHEEATGMLRGGLRLIHAIAIDVDNLSPRTIDLEVHERVPVTREGDDDVTVSVGKVEPAWEKWSPDSESADQARLRGGYRWKLAIPATTKKLLRATYEVKIAGKHELVGGNRRES